MVFLGCLNPEKFRQLVCASHAPSLRHPGLAWPQISGFPNVTCNTSASPGQEGEYFAYGRSIKDYKNYRDIQTSIFELSILLLTPNINLHVKTILLFQRSRWAEKNKHR